MQQNPANKGTIILYPKLHLDNSICVKSPRNKEFFDAFDFGKSYELYLPDTYRLKE